MEMSDAYIVADQNELFEREADPAGCQMQHMSHILHRLQMGYGAADDFQALLRFEYAVMAQRPNHKCLKPGLRQETPDEGLSHFDG